MDIDRFPSTRLPPLGQALVIRALRGEGPCRATGQELVTIRRAVAAGSHDAHPAAADHKNERRRLLGITKDDMPPAPADVRLLVETLSQRLGIVGYARAWAEIGITEKRGRDLLARSSRMVDWPIWNTLRRAALGR